ncbi:MAG: hypothetical protein GX195_07420 [Firmicutes bacterium]|jgi:hypothetical protein|nr:hypothetical protein [Bacillota bacterium]
MGWEDEYPHMVMLPYGNDYLHRSAAEFFLQQKRPPRLSVIEGKSLPLVP